MEAWQAKGRCCHRVRHGKGWPCTWQEHRMSLATVSASPCTSCSLHCRCPLSTFHLLHVPMRHCDKTAPRVNSYGNRSVAALLLLLPLPPAAQPLETSGSMSQTPGSSLLEPHASQMSHFRGEVWAVGVVGFFPRSPLLLFSFVEEQLFFYFLITPVRVDARSQERRSTRRHGDA